MSTEATSIKPYYSKDGIVVYHGDCREVMPELGFDAIITDPPYGIEHKSNGQRFRNASKIVGDEKKNARNLCDRVRATAALRKVACVMFFSPYNMQAGFRSILVWDKGAHVGIGGDRKTCWKRDYELIGVEGNGDLRGKRDSAVLRYPALLPPPSGHFCEKPVTLMQYLIYKIAAENILDPFMGSGTTLVAAKLEGRKAIGIEIEERYCEIAANRLRQGVLF
jgi:DNA modification methylase